MRRNLSNFVLTGLLAWSITLSAQAGLIKVNVDKGTRASVILRDADGRLVDQDSVLAGRDVTVIEFGFKEEDQKKAKKLEVNKQINGRRIEFTLNFKPLEINLASLEPFEAPTFVALANVFLATEIDIAGLLDQGRPFIVGQPLTVTNGSIPQTSTITFSNESGLPFDGTVEVGLFDQFLPIPEPSTLALLGLGILSFPSYIWRQRKPS